MAEKKQKRARYRRHRDDRFGHPKTGGMKLQAYGLFDFAVSQNMLGVMQQSPRAIAARFGNTLAEVNEAIRILCTSRNGEKPSAMWWPKLETLWIIEALDEQSDGDLVDRGAAKLLSTMPPEVQAAILDRYGKRVSGVPPVGTLLDTLPWGVSEGVSPQESGDRNQETGHRNPSGDDPLEKSHATETNADLVRILARIDEHRARHDLTPLVELEASARHPGSILKRLKTATVDECLAVVDAFGRLADADPSKRRLLCVTTPFTAGGPGKRGGWEWGQQMLDEERLGRARPQQPRGNVRILPSVDAVLAEQDSEVPR